MKTKAKLYKKNEFCYSMKRWPVSDESKPLLKEIVLDAIDSKRESISCDNPRELNGIWTYENSVLSKFTNKQMLALLHNLEQAVLGKPFFGITASTDLVLEELLHFVLTEHIKFYMEQKKEKTFKSVIQDIKKVYELNTEREKPTDENMLFWYEDGMWWDLDWLMFEIDTKSYSRKYLQFA